MHARVRLALFLVAPAVGALLSVQPVATQAPQQQPRTSPGLPSETPEKLEPVTDSFDYVKRDGDDPDAGRREAAHGDPRFRRARRMRRSC